MFRENYALVTRPNTLSYHLANPHRKKGQNHSAPVSV